MRENRELIPNAAAKYIINERTPGLKREVDGKVPLVPSAARPKRVAAANWLPISATPFVLAIRSRWPGKTLLDGTWTPAPTRKLKAVR